MNSATVNPDFVLNLMLVFAGTVVGVAFLFSIVGGIAFYKTQRGAATVLGQLVTQVGALQLLTVMTIVVSVLILALLRIIGEETVAAIFSGIAGYVLGGIGKVTAPAAKEERDPGPE